MHNTCVILVYTLNIQYIHMQNMCGILGHVYFLGTTSTEARVKRGSRELMAVGWWTEVECKVGNNGMRVEGTWGGG